MSALESVTRAFRARPSRIGARLLAFNLLVVFLPVAGILYLDVYERELLASQERGMIQQARMLAAALSGTDALGTAAPALLASIRERGDARLRVYDRSGALVADSARIPPDGRIAPPVERVDYLEPDRRTRLLYRFGAAMAAFRRTVATWVRQLIVGPGERDTINADPTQPLPEVRDALLGHYGASTRPTPGQRSLTLYSAVPVRDQSSIAGAVVVSQSTFRILNALYDVRLRIFQIVVASVIVAIVLSAIMSATVVRPLVRLRRAASALAERRSALPGQFRGSERRDEIGELARALEELTRRLDAHLRLLESFAADVSHEVRNPLASIRSAAEMMAVAIEPADRARFLELLTREVDRLERLVSGVRELAQIDAQMAQEPPTTSDVATLVGQIVEGSRLATGAPIALTTHGGESGAVVYGSPDRLVQVFENIIRNARSFAPSGTQVDVDIQRDGEHWRVMISDRGPGIPSAHLDRVFERFFTFRPSETPGAREHAGLGLAIARAIVHAYGGTISAANRRGGGASFTVLLPAMKRTSPF
jgi:two-component system, OmpR family, sensor histidine kinase ChvG